jgi:LAO/AO transport system kinase
MEKDITDKILNGDVRAAARLMRGIEDNLPQAVEELRHLYMHTGKAYIIGITGAPGVGKSTLADALITSFRKRKFKIGVVAVDPTSPFTGGALLGDRIRMGKHATDKDVFIRSLASRGWAGGLARATLSIVHVLDAMGKDIIMVEAVGSGQGEVDISRVADTTLVVLSPGMGDEIQMMKAGILEAADIFVINKADKEGAESLKIQVEQMLGIIPQNKDKWKPIVILAQAVNGKGIEETVETVLEHKRYLISSGQIKHRRSERARLELVEAIEHSLRLHVNEIIDDDNFQNLTTALAQRKIDPYSAAEQVLNRTIIAKKPRKSGKKNQDI